MTSATPIQAEGLEPVAWRWRFDDEGLTNWSFGSSPFGSSKNRAIMQPVAVEPLVRLSDAQAWRDRALAAEGREASGALLLAVQEAADAVAFFDRVKAASQDEKIAVGQDHWNRMEAALRSVAALTPESDHG